MRKLKKGRKFSRNRAQRKALLKSLAQSLLLREKIKTSEAKAKELRLFVEPLITRSKKADLAGRRYFLRYFGKKTVEKMIDELGPRYQTRPGGYTRIIKLGPRKSDGASMAIIELVR